LFVRVGQGSQLEGVACWPSLDFREGQSRHCEGCSDCAIAASLCCCVRRPYMSTVLLTQPMRCTPEKDDSNACSGHCSASGPHAGRLRSQPSFGEASPLKPPKKLRLIPPTSNVLVRCAGQAKCSAATKYLGSSLFLWTRYSTHICTRLLHQLPGSRCLHSSSGCS
jgi:hypothetical protein